MPLVRAFNSGISGLKGFQFKVDTIGNNLANVDTTGFKSTRVDFQTILSQTSSFGSGPSGSLGGIDPVQVGLGDSVKTTSRNFAQGNRKATGRPSDLAIDGDGFFIVKNGLNESLFTRDGAFALNSQNRLFNASNGFLLQGFQADFTTFAITPGGVTTALEVPIGTLNIARETDNAIFDGNLNGAGKISNSGTVLESSTFLQLAGAAGARLPVAGAERAGQGTLLTELGRQTVGGGFIDFQLSDGTIDANGDGTIDPSSVILVQATKGGRILPPKRFEVVPTSTAAPSPGNDDAGTSVRDFIDFLEDVLGINNTGGTNETYGGFIAGGTVTAVAGAPVSSISFADPGGVIAAQLETDDYIRFTSGPGAGQIGELTAAPVVAAGITTLTFTALDATRPQPGIGTLFELNEAARVSIGVAAPPAGDPFPGLDGTAPIPPDAVPAAKEDLHSLGGRFRIAGNAGLDNALRSLEISVGTTQFSLFQELKSAVGESTISNATFFDSLGAPHTVELTYVLQSKNDAGNRFRWFAEAEDNNVVANNGADRVVGTGFIQFDANGKFVSEGPLSAINLDLSNSGATTPLIVSQNHTRLTGFAGQFSDVALVDQDGFEQGTLRNFAINADGVVQGVFTNGQIRDIAQVALARFANNNGLNDAGDNLFSVGANSGLALIGTANSFGRGVVRSGFLEESNVDIAEQFTDLITSQRAFQANARTITVANEMLQELVNI